ncbi:MAG: Coenzyme F420 hydrogenase/dehydrogenase, beta subunit C-terminal domain [Candidatus Lokiarchaeota archaeon]|nr:Coenzyme F420 hydrogenase/dehydrogenase, beta subunit C-terminal domain [Candidatus Lokiarchaeota archaeon]
MKTEKCLVDLQLEVIYNDKCIMCGSCGAFCQNIYYDGGKLNYKEQCSETVGVCYNFCPRAELNIPELELKIFGKKREDQALGVYDKAIKATLKNAAMKDVTTAVLVAALESGLIDSAVLGNAKVEKALEPVLCKSKDEIVGNAGERKGLGPLVQGVGHAIKAKQERIAIVGRPCHAQGLAKIRKNPDFLVNQDKIALVVAHACLAQGKGCTVCIDYSGEFADLSVDVKTGEALVRSEAGQKAIDAAVKKGYIEVGHGNVEAMQKAAATKRVKNFAKVLAKGGDVVSADYVKVDMGGMRFLSKE